MKKLLFLLLLLPTALFAQLATVTTNNTVTNNVNGLRVDCGGNVTSQGGSAVTQRGLVWSTSPNPTRSIIPSSDNYANTSGSGVGTFTDYVAPLRPSTTYYLRAFATNGSGIAYGNEVVFTTPAGRAPKKYYFNSVTGNDANNGSISAPWRTLTKLKDSIISGNVTFVPGDTIFFARGSTFTGPYRDNFAGFYWVQKPQGDFTAPSGTPQKPIVLTSYGDPSLPKPNFLSPYTTPPVNTWPNSRPARHVWQFSGVKNIVIDGLQSFDNRPEAPALSDKRNPGLTGGWLMGEWTKAQGFTTVVGGKTVYNVTRPGSTNPLARNSMIDSFVVRNCVFNNVQYGFSGIAATNSIFEYDTITNLKTTTDTAGINDVGACAFEAMNGFNVTVRNCYVKGAWGKSGRISSTGGLLGVGIDAFGLYNSKFIYNTFIDCGGFIEIGNIDPNDSTAGCQYDTFAFNKIINCSNVATVHGRVGDPFRGNNHHLYFWNNAVVFNNLDRIRGVGFGADTYNDGQGFRPGMPGAFWFCRTPYATANIAPRVPTTITTAGSNIVTVSSITGIRVGTVAFIENDSLLGRTYQTVTVLAIDTPTLQLTLSVAATQDRTVTPDDRYTIKYYLPVADQTWSQPENFSTSDFVWNTSVCLVGGDNVTEWGNNIDTLVDTRNNLFYWTNGNGGIKNQTRYKRSNNVYSPIGGVRGPTTLGPPGSGGAVLNATGTGERQITNQSIFADTTAAYPENWNLALAPSLRANTVGASTPGINRDFAGNTYTTPFVGLFSYTTATTVSAAATTTPILCNGGSSTVTVTATGGTPPYTGVGTFTRTAGTYTFGVSDALGASATVTVTITQPAALTGTIAFTSPQTSTITAVASASGGTPPYRYLLKNASVEIGPQSSNTFTGIAYGSGTITITDTNACSVIIPYTINAAPTTGKKYYVSAIGSNNNDGLTPNTPWQTLGKVSSSQGIFAAGDSIFFRRGDKFSGSIVLSSKTGLYFGAYGTGANPLFWGTGSTISALFRVRTCSSVVFQGLTISDTTISSADRSVLAKIQVAFVIEASSTGNTVKNVIIDRVGQGVYATGTSPGQTIDSCNIGNLRMIRNTLRDTICKVTLGCANGQFCAANPNTCDSIINVDDDYGAVPIQLSSSNHRVTNNYFYGAWAPSFDYGYDGGGIEFYGEGVTIQNNFIAYNTFFDCNGTFEFGSRNANFPIQNNIIAYNKIINTSSLMYYNNSGQYRTVVRNLQFYNNACLQDTTSRTGTTIYFGRATADTATSSILVLKNNVFRITTGTDIITSSGFNNTQFQHTNNIYDLSNGSVTNFTLSTAEANATSRYWADTTNSNPLLWNYSPRSGGQLINTGANLGFTRDFAGSPISSTPDIGALEFQASAVTLLATATVGTPIRCYGGTTTLTIAATGGTPPYTGTGTFTRSAGPYNYVVTDALGSTYTIIGNITQPAELVGAVSFPSIACNGDFTTIIVSCTGGTPPYFGTGSFTEPALGNWGYLLYDSGPGGGCATVVEFTLTQPPKLSANAVPGTITVNGGTTSITVTASGGTGAYQYKLNNGAYQSSNVFTGIVAGAYTITVIDSLGCTTITTLTVSQPGPAGTKARSVFVNEE